LRAIFEMLNLTAAALVDRIVRARRLDTLRRWFEEQLDRSLRETLSWLETHARSIGRRRSRNEHDHVTGARDAVAARAERLDRQLDRLTGA